MENMGSTIHKNNKKVLSNNNNHNNNESLCNCRSKEQCPLNNNCLSSSIIYNAQITTTDNKTPPKNYIGLTEGTFKQRFNQHKVTFRHRKYTNSTELSKYIWQLKDNSVNFNIKWSIIARARPYNNTMTRCNLCLTEKLMIIKSNSNNLLNKRSEPISKCHHENNRTEYLMLPRYNRLLSIYSHLLPHCPSLIHPHLL